MKTRNILAAALVMMMSSTVMADETKTLVISYGETEQSLPLPVVQRIAFQDGNVVVTTTEGTHSYPISVIQRISFGTTEDATAISALPEEAENLAYKDGKLSVKGDGLLRIYGTNGALVSISEVKEGANVSLDRLPAGVYIVRMGEKTIKVRK